MDFFRIIVENFLQYRSLFGSEYDFDTEYVNSYWTSAIENMIFRSLTETEGKEQIRQTILQTLADGQVLHWYEQRKPENDFEREVSALVTSGQREKALAAYEKIQKKKNRKQRIRSLLSAFKRRVRRIISN
jgi:hypothetical protein